MTVLLGAMASAMVIATRAVPDGGSPIEALTHAASALEQTAAELHVATEIKSNTSTGITFAVPDLDGDGNDDTITYAWAGTAGDPLTRQFNTGTAVDFVEDVHDFSLSYDLLTVAEEVPGELVESARQQLSSYYLGLYLADGTVDDESWWGQYFKPSFSADVLAWNIQDISLRAIQVGSPTGMTRVQLRPANADFTPAATVIEEVEVYESSFPDPSSPMTWWQIPFSAATNFSPDEGICLLLMTDNEDAWGHQYYTAGVVNPDIAMLWNDNDASGWVVSGSRSLRYMCYGTVITRGDPQTVDVHYLRGARLALQVSSLASARVDTEVQVLNLPEASGP
jgi:hypothetical protein